MSEDKDISAFAFNTGREIEKFINERNDDLDRRNKVREAMILEWYMKTKDEEFFKHFNLVRS